MNWTFVQILSHRFPLIAWNNINIAANRNQLPLRTVQICLKNTFAINLTCQYAFLQIRAQQSAYDMNWHDGGTLHATNRRHARVLAKAADDISRTSFRNQKGNTVCSFLDYFALPGQIQRNSTLTDDFDW